VERKNKTRKYRIEFIEFPWDTLYTIYLLACITVSLFLSVSLYFSVSVELYAKVFDVIYRMIVFPETRHTFSTDEKRRKKNKILTNDLRRWRARRAATRLVFEDECVGVFVCINIHYNDRVRKCAYTRRPTRASVLCARACEGKSQKRKS